MRLTQPDVLHALTCGLFAAGSLAAAAQAGAQARIEALPDSVLRPYSVRSAGPLSGLKVPSPAAPGPVTVEPRLRDYSWLGGAVQVEGPRESYDGSYTRPKVVVGVPSETMRDWMNSAGFSAEQCLLPMVRARARVGADGDANGTVWLYARCSFQ
ncbi:MAG TPA: hypothetical protein PLE54_17130 [Burkholderiaceae bacterium]|nr:hypothetical protein [Burkholderiaceae bacterium]HQR72332.1 hypothetical protein [Burkholderiaceae bacterium]